MKKESAVDINHHYIGQLCEVLGVESVNKLMAILDKYIHVWKEHIDSAIVKSDIESMGLILKSINGFAGLFSAWHIAALVKELHESIENCCDIDKTHLDEVIVGLSSIRYQIEQNPTYVRLNNNA